MFSSCSDISVHADYDALFDRLNGHSDQLIQDRLLKLKRITEVYSSASWDTREDSRQLYLISERIFNPQHITFIKKTVIEEKLKTITEGAPDIIYKEFTSPDNQVFVRFIIFSNLTDGYLNELEKIYFETLEIRQQKILEAKQIINIMNDITGMVWSEPLHQEKKILTKIRVWCPCVSDDYKRKVVKFNEEFRRYCKENNFIFDDKKMLITREKMDLERVSSQRYYVLNVGAIAKYVVTYHEYLSKLQNRQAAIAGHIGQQLVSITEERLNFCVLSKIAFYDPQLIQLQSTQPIPKTMQDKLQRYFLGGKLEECLLVSKSNVMAIVFALDKLDKAAIRQDYEDKKISDSQSIMKNNKKQLLDIEKRLQLVLVNEKQELREHISAVVQESESRLQQNIDHLDQRIYSNIEKRLGDFTREITRGLNEQNLKLSNIQESLDDAKLLLLQMHEMQQQFFIDQKKIIQDIISTRLSGVLGQGYVDFWQNKMKVLLAKRYEKNVGSLQDFIVSSVSSESTKENHSFLSCDRVAEQFEALKQSTVEEQQSALTHYHSALSEHLDQNSELLQQSFFQVQTLQQSFHLLLEYLPELTGKFLCIDLSTEAIDFTELVNELASFCDIELARLFDWEAILKKVISLDNSFRSSKVAAQLALQEILEQQWFEVMPSFMIDYTTKILSPKTEEIIASDKDTDNLGLFEQIFVATAKESIDAILNVARGIDDVADFNENSDINKLIDQTTDLVTELVTIVPIPGIHLILKAIIYGGKKYYRNAEKNYCGQVLRFFAGEPVEKLLTETAQGIYQRYQNQIDALSIASLNKLINKCMLPCILAEMANADEQVSILSYKQKLQRLIFSTRHHVYPGYVTLATKEGRAIEWTIKGLIWYPAVRISQPGLLPNSPPTIVYYGLKKKLGWPLPEILRGSVPHEYYGVRNGSMDEIDELFQLLDKPPTLDETVTPVTPDAFFEQFSISLIPKFIEDPKKLFVRDKNGWNGLIHLANRLDGQVLLEFIRAWMTQTNSWSAILKKTLQMQTLSHGELLLRALRQQDNDDQNILHHYISVHFQGVQKLEIAQSNLVELFKLLTKLSPKMPWHYEVNAQQQTPFALVYAHWCKHRNQQWQLATSAYLSALCSSHMTPHIKIFFETFQLFQIMHELDFTSPLQPLIFSLYEFKEHQYIIWFLQDCNQFLTTNDQGNNLLHIIAEKNDTKLIQEFFLEPNWHANIAKSFSQRNKVEETPLMIAAKKHNADVMWALAKFCRQSHLLNNPDEKQYWGLEQALSLAEEQVGVKNALKAVKNVETEVEQLAYSGKKIGSSWFGFMRRHPSTRQLSSKKLTK